MKINQSSQPIISAVMLFAQIRHSVDGDTFAKVRRENGFRLESIFGVYKQVVVAECRGSKL